MTKVILEINTTQVFESVDSARAAGIAVDSALGEHAGSIKLVEIPGFKSHSLHPDFADSTQFTYGGQIIDGRITALVKSLTSAIPELAGQDLADNVKVLDGKNWTVDYQQLFNNVKTAAGDIPTSEAFQSAVSDVLAGEALRGMKLRD